MRIKKKLALLLASTLLVTSMNVMPVEATTSNTANGSENENAVVNTDLTLSIAALNSNQGNTVTNATGNTVLSLSVEALGENQGNTVKNATGSTNLTLQVEALNDNQGNTKINATGSTTLTLVIGEDNTESILADAKEIVTSKIIDNKFTVSNLTTDKDIENAIKTALLSDDKTKTVASEITVTKVEASTEAAGKIAINVKLSLNDKNITFDLNKVIDKLEGENILAKAQEIVTSKINKLSVSNLTTNEDIENAIKTALLSDDKTKSVESKITAEKTEAKVGTDGQIAINVKLILNDKNITFDLKKTITALDGRNITVTVQGDNNQPISDAEVKVMLGKNEKVKLTSSDHGVYEFPNLPAGLYNIVITKDGVTKTDIANITTDNATVSVVWDTSSFGSSHLNVKDTTVPKAATKVEETVVKNLDALAEALKEIDPEVSSYKVDMAVEAKADKQIPQNTQNEMVKEANKGESAATDKATNIDFLDISIIKTITKSSGTTETKQIAYTGDTVIEIIIPFNFTGKTNVKVLREHNGVVKKFDKTNTGADGTYKIDEENGLIILYAKYFSTYAVSYVAEGEDAIVEPVAPTYPTYTGGVSVPATIPATGITVEADKVELTKAGETLAIKAVIQPSNATDKKLTFTSSDEKVAKVDANGVITAVGNGTATITVKAANGITKTITVTVNIPSEENKDDNSSAEEEAVTSAKTAANAIAINKGLKVSQTGTKINVSWGKVAGADGYLVYAAYCGTDIGKAVKTIKDPSSVSTTITKLGGKKLDLKKTFKVYVKAYKLVDGKKAPFGKSITAHIAGSKNTKETNVKELKLTSKSKLTLAVGKTSKIKAKVVLVDATKKQLSDSHTKEFRYASSDKKIAAVDKNGKITAKAKGTCYIYVYAKNGYAKKVTVTVK